MQITNETQSTFSETSKQESKNANSSLNFSDELNSNEEKSQKQLEKEKMDKLLADIDSLLRTGLTVEEFERLQELLAQIKKLAKESENDPDIKKELEKQMSALENELYELQKRKKGIVVEGSNSGKQNENDTQKSIQTGLEERINNLQKQINDLQQPNQKESMGNSWFINQQLSFGNTQTAFLENLKEQMKQDYKDSMTQNRFDLLLKELGITNLDQEQKEMYRSIINDREITYDEIENLSYEEIQTLNKFIMQKDEYENYKEETMIHYNTKVAHVLNVSKISHNENFNKAVFESLKLLDDSREFMALVTGTHNFPTVPSRDYDSSDPQMVLTELIQEHQQMFQTSNKPEEMAYHKKVASIFSNLLQTFNVMNEENSLRVTTYDNEQDIKTILFDDLISVLQTGITKSEQEYIEKLTMDIKRLIDESTSKEIPIKQIEKLVEKLKSSIEQIQQRYGQDIKENDDVEVQQDESKNLSLEMKKLEKIVLQLEKVFHKLLEQTSKNDELKDRKQ